MAKDVQRLYLVEREGTACGTYFNLGHAMTRAETIHAETGIECNIVHFVRSGEEDTWPITVAGTEKKLSEMRPKIITARCQPVNILQLADRLGRITRM